MTINPCPQSVAEVHACPCQSCRAMSTIWQRCEELGEPLYVADGRMFGKGFVIADYRRAYTRLGPVREHVLTLEAAVDAVRGEFGQEHCDAFVSTWPLKPAGHSDYLYAAELSGGGPGPAAH